MWELQVWWVDVACPSASLSFTWLMQVRVGTEHRWLGHCGPPRRGATGMAAGDESSDLVSHCWPFSQLCLLSEQKTSPNSGRKGRSELDQPCDSANSAPSFLQSNISHPFLSPFVM